MKFLGNLSEASDIWVKSIKKGRYLHLVDQYGTHMKETQFSVKRGRWNNVNFIFKIFTWSVSSTNWKKHAEEMEKFFVNIVYNFLALFG